MSEANVSTFPVAARARIGWKRWALVVAVVAMIAAGGGAWAVVAHRNNALVEAWSGAAAGLADQMTASQAVVDDADAMLRLAEGVGVDPAGVDAGPVVLMIEDLEAAHSGIAATADIGLADGSARADLVQSGPQSGSLSAPQSGTSSGLSELDVIPKSAVFVVDDSGRPAIGDLESDTAAMITATGKLTAGTDILSEQLTALRPAVDARIGELQTALDAERDALDEAITKAQKTLDTSKGKVAKKTTRDDLATAISEGRARLSVLPATASIPPSDLERRTQSLTAGIEQLHTSVTAVEKSIAAKEKADAEAAAEAAAQTQASSVGEYSDDSTAWTGSSNDAGSWSGSTTTGDDYVPQSDECIPGTQCYVYDDDGWEHHQIHPDSNGEYVDSGDLW